MKTFESFLMFAVCLSMGGCISLSAGCGPSQDRVVTIREEVKTVQAAPSKSWPPATIVLEPQAIYVTGLSNQSGVRGLEEALGNAQKLATNQGLINFSLSEVFQDLGYVGDNGFTLGTRIFYRVIQAPK